MGTSNGASNGNGHSKYTPPVYTQPGAYALTEEQELKVLELCEVYKDDFDEVASNLPKNFGFTATKDQIRCLLVDKAVGIR